MGSSRVRLYGATSGFVELAAPDVADDGVLVLPTVSSGGFGGLVAVKHVLKTDTFTASSVAPGGNVAVTGLSITHEVADSANRLIISAHFGTSANSAGFGNTGLSIAVDGTLIAIGDAEGSRSRVGAGAFPDKEGATYIGAMPSVTFVYTPGAGSKVYTVRAVNMTGSAQTVYVNRTEDDNNTFARPRAVSSLVIQEVRV